MLNFYPLPYIFLNILIQFSSRVPHADFALKCENLKRTLSVYFFTNHSLYNIISVSHFGTFKLYSTFRICINLKRPSHGKSLNVFRPPASPSTRWASETNSARIIGTRLFNHYRLDEQKYSISRSILRFRIYFIFKKIFNKFTKLYL